MALQPGQQRVHHVLKPLVLDVVVGRFVEKLNHVRRDFVKPTHLVYRPLPRLQQLRFFVVLRQLLIAHALLQQRHAEGVSHTGIAVRPFGQKLVN